MTFVCVICGLIVIAMSLFVVLGFVNPNGHCYLWWNFSML